MNSSGKVAVHSGLTGIAFDSVVRHLLYEPEWMLSYRQ